MTPTTLLAAPRRWLRGLYDWTMHWADTRQSLAALFAIAVAESSFFPIPPDVLLIAIVGSNARKWLRAAVLCSIGSIVGAVVGYWIGWGFMATVGRRIVDFYQAQHAWDRVVTLYNGEWGIWFLAGAAFTPIPYKVATIAAGATGMPLVPFVTVSLFGRAGRFFLVAGALRLFGPRIRRLPRDQAALTARAYRARAARATCMLYAATAAVTPLRTAMSTTAPTRFVFHIFSAA
jgi:membrane protein YqaA with SNARE-associated domain